MKQTLSKILRVVTTVLMVASICIMLFTVVSVLTFNRTDRQLFGYRAFIVLSDSMSATDFSAGDLVLTRDVDPSTLQPGDIIAFTSTNTESYGQVVTHKIRSLTTTGSGEPGFITYGTTTDTNDEAVVTYMDVLGKYSGCAGSGSDRFVVKKLHIDRSFPGTGDLYGAVLIGSLIQGNALSADADNAAEFVSLAIQNTPAGQDTRFGVWFEPLLPRLCPPRDF